MLEKIAGKAKDSVAWPAGLTINKQDHDSTQEGAHLIFSQGGHALAKSDGGGTHEKKSYIFTDQHPQVEIAHW